MFLKSFWILVNFVIFTTSNESKCDEVEIFNKKCLLSCYDINEFNLNVLNKSLKCSWTLTFKSIKNKRVEVSEDYFNGGFSHLSINKISFISLCIKKLEDDLIKSLFNDESDMSYQFWSLTITKSVCLSEIDDDAFKPTPYLKYLDLSFNMIYKIDDEAFQGLHTLDILKLNNNKLTKISRELFASLISLKMLDVSVNNIEYIDPLSFKTTTKLELLKLNRNKLKQLSYGVFDKFKYLHTLDLSYNELEIFSPECFSNYAKESLGTLYLNNNRLKTLSYQILDFKNINPSHLDISLADNLWICDYNLAWIKKFSNFIREKSIKCYLPPKFKDLTIDNISFDLLKNTNSNQKIPEKKDVDETSFKDEIIGVVVSVFCVILFLLLLFFGYRNRWCSKLNYWENNRAQFVKTEVEPDEESEICMIYIEEVDKSGMVSV